MEKNFRCLYIWVETGFLFANRNFKESEVTKMRLDL